MYICGDLCVFLRLIKRKRVFCGDLWLIQEKSSE